jgi:hypothetical protein
MGLSHFFHRTLGRPPRDTTSCMGHHHLRGKTMHRLLYASLSVALLHVIGCTLPGRQYQTPRPTGQQQLEATQWDPYADVDAGPEIVGSRPREFQRPAAEPVRARGFQETRWPF